MCSCGATFVLAHEGCPLPQDPPMTDRRERQVTGGLALRLRQVIDAYGSANSIAKSIERSEGDVRKCLRGKSEPSVTDLRTLCVRTQTSIEWLVTGRGRREVVHTPAAPA